MPVVNPNGRKFRHGIGDAEGRKQFHGALGDVEVRSTIYKTPPLLRHNTHVQPQHLTVTNQQPKKNYKVARKMGPADTTNTPFHPQVQAKVLSREPVRNVKIKSPSWRSNEILYGNVNRDRYDKGKW